MYVFIFESRHLECTQVGGTGSIYTYYGPDEKLFANLTNNFLTKDIKLVMPSLGLASEPIPLWWTGARTRGGRAFPSYPCHSGPAPS